MVKSKNLKKSINTKVVIYGLVILLGLYAFAYKVSGEYLTDRHAGKVFAARETALTYFIDSVVAKVKVVPDYDKQGLTDGADGFNFIKVYPGLVPRDFSGVQAYQGHYFEKDGKLFFEGNAASNSGVILRDGMKTLLDNISKRLGIAARNTKDVEKILDRMSAE